MLKGPLKELTGTLKNNTNEWFLIVGCQAIANNGGAANAFQYISIFDEQGTKIAGDIEDSSVDASLTQTYQWSAYFMRGDCRYYLPPGWTAKTYLTCYYFQGTIDELKGL